MAEKSFLATVKSEIDSAFASAYDALIPITTNDDDLGVALVTLKRAVWVTVEKRLKESFQNGRKAANGNDSASKTERERKPNPFRTE
jgi:hypothetical protein